MSTVQIILGVILIIVSVIIVVLVLMQESKAELSGAIAGGSSTESFFGKNKKRTKEAKLGRLTVILGSVFGAVTLISSLLLLFFNGK